MSDQYPTVREVLDGDAEFPSNAYNNADGMLTVPEPGPTVSDQDDYVQSGGMWLPKPKDQKQVTVIAIEGIGTLVVSNPIGEVREILKSTPASQDCVFQGPVFPDEPTYLMATFRKKVGFLAIDYRDLDEIKLQQDQREYAKKLAKDQMIGAKSGLSVSPNNALPFPFNNQKRRR